MPVRDARQRVAQSDQHAKENDQGVDSHPDDREAVDGADYRTRGQGDGGGCSTAGQPPSRTQSARSASAGLAGTDSADSFSPHVYIYTTIHPMSTIIFDVLVIHVAIYIGSESAPNPE